MIDLDLFAGAGGLAVGMSEVGFRPMRLYELDTSCCHTLSHNIESKNATLDGSVIEADVASIQWNGADGPVRVVASGTPCQPFSLAGKHLAYRDGRNLFPEVLRAVRSVRPMAVVLENVSGLLRPSFRPYFEYILRQLECPSVRPRKNEVWQDHHNRIQQHQCSVGYEPEYYVSWRKIDAADYGVPQNRVRVFVVATRADVGTYRFPPATHSKEALLSTQANGAYWERHSISARTVANRRNGKSPIQRSQADREPWVTVRDAILDLPPPSAREKGSALNHWLISGARKYAGHVGSDLDWPAKTVKAGVHGVPGGENTLVDGKRLRYLTLRELARLQTFPDDHLFVGSRSRITKQIGNAVPCRLAAAIAQPLYELLAGSAAKGGRPTT